MSGAGLGVEGKVSGRQDVGPGQRAQVACLEEDSSGRLELEDTELSCHPGYSGGQEARPHIRSHKLDIGFGFETRSQSVARG